MPRTSLIAWSAVPLLAALLSVSANAESVVAQGYQKIKVAEGVYAFIAPEPRSEIVTGNSIAVIGDDGVLVVDSGHFPSATRHIIDEIRQMTDKPVRYLVNTHWHPDHNVGNGQYKQAFPDVVILSTPSTREQMNAQVPTTYIHDVIEKYPQIMPIIQQRLDTGKKKDGTPLRPVDKQHYQDLLEDAKDFIPELQQATYTAPNQTFDQAVTVYLGKRQVNVMFLGRGNTMGDAVVYVPDAKVLATGDLVVAPTPYSFGSFLTEWVDTLRKLEALGATTIVPGHGDVQHDTTYINQLIALFQATTAQVKQCVAQGLSLEDTRKKVDLSSFRKQMAGDSDKWNEVFYTAYEVPAVERAYREAKEGKLNDEN